MESDSLEILSTLKAAVRAAVKLPLAVAVIAVYSIHQLLCGVFAFSLRHTSEQLQDARVSNTQLYSWLFLRVAGFRIELQADPSALDGRTALWVSNHLSYVDAMLFSALHPVAFITSKEVESTFFLGFMAKLTGCVFIERRSRDFLDREVSSVTSLLQRGISVGLYPEATSSGGEGILPFKHAFFRAAIEADCPVQPLVLQYERIDGRPIDCRNRDCVFYYGDVSFAKQFWSMLGCGRIDVTVRALKPIESSEAPVESGYDHHTLAIKAEERITAVYRPISSGNFTEDLRIPTIA